MVTAPHYPEAPSIAAVLADRARHLGTRPWITLPDGTFTYYDVDDGSRRLARALLDLGYMPGDIVAVLCSNSSPLIMAWSACSLLGMVFMPVNILLTGDFLVSVLAHAQV